ncbi:MAG: hypothetical protein ACTH7J_09495, partial [Glutamicibacter ardleyensis]
QNVNYRVQLNADGSSCLLTAAGEKLRCSSDAGQNSGSEQEGEQSGDLLDPSTLSNEELKSLHEAIVDELHQRIPAQ